PFPRLGTIADELVASFEPECIDPGVRTLIPALDSLLGGGIRPGQLVVFAGLTGSGKSALALQVALQAAHAASLAGDGETGPSSVLYISFEMLVAELYLRAVHLARETSGPFRREDRGWRPADLPIAIAGVRAIAGLPLVVLDDVPRTVEAIRATVEQHILLVGQPVLVVIDHIGLVQAPRITNRVEAVGHITGSLKMMALQLGLPVFALAQLNREGPRRDKKRPVLPDLRESGAVEQDADVVAFLHRESYFLDLAERARVEAGPVPAEVIIAKHRAGETGTVAVTWHGRRFLMWPAEAPAGPIGILDPPTGRAASTAAPDPDVDRAVAVVAGLGGWVTREAFNARAGLVTSAWGNHPVQRALDLAVAAGRVERTGEGRGLVARYRAVATVGPGGTAIAPEGALRRLLPDPAGLPADDIDDEALFG
ncbi:MAG: DnaB-like helicase C-terminal domain-containing protein, partial [Chloroflexota bacterium]